MQERLCLNNNPKPHTTMLKIIKLTLALFVVLFFSTCKKECCQDPSNPKCENYDPCYGKKNINTLFKVRPGDRGFKPPEEWCNLIPCDTFNASSVRFDAPDGNPANSTYEWQIGTEVNPRKGKGLEVDFGDYLRDNGWERWIPIKLTIRTPINSCITNPKDTLVSITRNLFFTQKPILLLENGETSIKYKGYFAHEPKKEVVMEFFQLEKGSFRGVPAPFALIIGLPIADTLMLPKSSGNPEVCFNYKSQIIRYLTPNNTNSIHTRYMSETSIVFIQNNNKYISRKFKFSPPSGELNYEFHGTKM